MRRERKASSSHPGKHESGGSRGWMWGCQAAPRACLKSVVLGFPGGAVVKNLPANAGDMGSSPGPGRSHMPRSN